MADMKIEVVAPLSAAMERTREILFRPFSLEKWLVIGFAAFLAGLADGTRVNFTGNFGAGDFKGQSTSETISGAQEQISAWLVGGVIVVVAVVLVALILLAVWAGSRGRFMFIDCIVRNRGAIAEPWREYRREGNSLFLFTLAAMLAWLLIIAALASPLLFSYFGGAERSLGVGSIIYLIVAAALLGTLGMMWTLLMWFVPVVMFRQRCRALDALTQMVKLAIADPVPFILFALLLLLVVIAGSIVSCVITCLTCCIAMIPYIGTVILLPVYTFYYAYTLLFLRQFGPDFDAWAAIRLPELDAGDHVAPSADAAAPQDPPPATT